MSVGKILAIGIFGIMGVMLFTAMIHMIAPYVAAILVLGTIAYFVLSKDPPKADTPDE